jgi:hypothetical protein
MLATTLSSLALLVTNPAMGTPLVQVVLTLIVVGVVLWLINRFIPMQSSIKSILNAVVVIVVVLWLLNVFGLMNTLTNLRVGH